MLFASLAAFAAPPSAGKIMADAEAQADAQGKSIFLIFGATWCPWCHHLDRFIETRDIEPIISRHFVIARVDVQERGDMKRQDTPGGDELMAQVGGKNAAGLPFFAFLDSHGKLIVNSLRPVPGKSEGVNIGHPVQPEEVDWFMSMLRKAAPALTAEESLSIENYLRNQRVK
jgi:thioredoxin-related protein